LAFRKERDRLKQIDSELSKIKKDLLLIDKSLKTLNKVTTSAEAAPDVRGRPKAPDKKAEPAAKAKAAPKAGNPKPSAKKGPAKKKGR